MDALAPFRIPVATLKADEASYEWELGPEFLTIFDDEHEPVDGQFTVGMELHRAAGIATLEFAINGSINTTCDRCLVPIKLPIVAEYQLVVKFGDPNESTDEVVFMGPEAPDLNVGQHIYDFILLSIPISHRIPDCENLENSPCDTSILSYLAENEKNNDSGGDDDENPWNELKKVIDN
jgi:uncharacterized metal-binding protein YceD (DUF177 family)